MDFGISCEKIILKRYFLVNRYEEFDFRGVRGCGRPVDDPAKQEHRPRQVPHLPRSGRPVDSNNNKRASIKLALLLFRVREKIRTPDTLVRSQVLYPAELHTRIRIFFVPCYFTRIVTISQELFLFF